MEDGRVGLIVMVLDIKAVLGYIFVNENANMHARLLLMSDF